MASAFLAGEIEKSFSYMLKSRIVECIADAIISNQIGDIEDKTGLSMSSIDAMIDRSDWPMELAFRLAEKLGVISGVSMDQSSFVIHGDLLANEQLVFEGMQNI